MNSTPTRSAGSSAAASAGSMSPLEAHPVVDNLLKGNAGSWVSESHDNYRSPHTSPAVSPHAFPRSSVWADAGAGRSPTSATLSAAAPPHTRASSPRRTGKSSPRRGAGRSPPRVHVNRRGSIDIMFDASTAPPPAPRPAWDGSTTRSSPLKRGAAPITAAPATLEPTARYFSAPAVAPRRSPRAPPAKWTPASTTVQLTTATAWDRDQTSQPWETAASPSTSGALSRLTGVSNGSPTVLVRPVPLERGPLTGYADVDRILYRSRATLKEEAVNYTAIDEARARRAALQADLSAGY